MRRSLSMDPAPSPSPNRAVISRPNFCMKWVEAMAYVAHEECGLTEVCGGCWEGMKFVVRTGTEECTCDKVSPDGMSCAEFSCKRDFIVQGGMNSASSARPRSSLIAFLAGFVLFLYSY